MNSLLILLYVVVWRVCTILRVIAPVSAVRAWCEYQLEGMTILRDAYSSLAKAAGMQNEAFEYLKGIARHLGYESGGDQLKSGLFRPFLWHIRAKGHRLGAVMEMEVWKTWKNGCNNVCNPWEDIYNPWERGWNDGWTECLNQRVAGILKQACVDFSDAD
ncbi:hypothetical protein GXS59_000885 [Salmonella enterica]|uniref:Uncharacterized protein n=5 Tax=Salmonella enterica TaxID=28901 RepID=A0A5V3TY35_SALER|nr:MULTISPECIES: hypothetical protein [Enterobacteriaceae]EAM4214909.1 hypothetical protein [Salmonella enterica]EBH8522314.1 hypothetical protein [Salmonella enterica subsp. enterica serovar Typhi str. CR0044]EHQ7554836.1 hypothetical protein [Salmonella enterica subsp. enterica]HAD4384246.1 hypothetical protein [Salmonella enterica subsp. enterica serovar Typhi str. CT18]EAA5198687.1 hypothetical protein [Salmonella enterica subsp. enterica serovar Typhi]